MIKFEFDHCPDFEVRFCCHANNAVQDILPENNRVKREENFLNFNEVIEEIVRIILDFVSERIRVRHHRVLLETFIVIS